VKYPSQINQSAPVSSLADASILDDLERSLHDQLLSLGKGQSRGLEGRLRQIASLVETARKMSPDALRRKRDQLTKIRQLHEQLLVTLRQRTGESHTRQNRLQGGKRALRAYGR
jgi:hypothetical protein